ncbi:MAG: hypothetical protein ABI995_10610, partial [Acidobacteriota bacterium]
MRVFALLTLLAVAGCSHAPTPGETYQRTWAALRQGTLKQAQDLLDANAPLPAHPQADELTLLRAEVLLARGQAREADDLLRALPLQNEPNLQNEPSLQNEPNLRLRLLADQADSRWKTGHPDEAARFLDEVDQTAGSSTADPVFKSLL